MVSGSLCGNCNSETAGINEPFDSVRHVEKRARGGTIMEELIRKIELILIETGQHDLKFKLGEIIKYSPKEVGEILRKHKDELR